MSDDVTGGAAMRSIQAALDNVLAPLKDAPVNSVEVSWTPVTGASIRVFADEQRGADR